MSDPRLPRTDRPPADARFRCPVCARFVHAGPSGLCPSCGFHPPAPVRIGRRDPLAWQRAGRRSARPSAGYWLAVALFAITVAAVAAAAAVDLL